MVSSFHFDLVVLGKVCSTLSADCFSVDTQPRRAHKLPLGSIVGYTLPKLLHLSSVLQQSHFRLRRTILQIVFHTNLLIFNIEKVADFSSSPTLKCVLA